MFLNNQDFKLFHGDMLTMLDLHVPDKPVDMIFTDPPCNLSNDGFTCRGGRMVSVNKGDWDRSRGPEANFEFHRTWIADCYRKLRPGGTIWISGTYHSIYQCGYALQMSDWHVLNDVSYFKPNVTPSLSCRMLTASHETLVWARTSKKDKHVYNYETMKYGDCLGDKIKVPDKQM